MLKYMIGLVLIFVMAVWLSHYLMDPSAYVFISFAHYAIEMPFWFAVISLVVIFLLLYAVLRFLKVLTSFFWRIKQWWRTRQQKRVQRLTTRGLIEFAEGDWRKAEKHLIRATNKSENPLVNYLAAARAAQEQGAMQRRDEYLAKAEEIVPNAELAIGLSQAQLQMASGQLDEALASLRHLKTLSPRHQTVLKLLQEIYVKFCDWQQLIILLPELHKYKVLPENELRDLEIKAYTGMLESILFLEDKNQILKIWKNIPYRIRQYPEVIAAYSKKLQLFDLDDEAEKCLYNAIRAHWNDELVNQYGLVTSKALDKQLKKAESWLNGHPHDSVLLLTLGRLAIKNQLWGKARSYLETSLAYSAKPETYGELARLLERLGDTDRAKEFYRKGLQESLI